MGVVYHPFCRPSRRDETRRLRRLHATHDAISAMAIARLISMAGDGMAGGGRPSVTFSMCGASILLKFWVADETGFAGRLSLHCLLRVHIKVLRRSSNPNLRQRMLRTRAPMLKLFRLITPYRGSVALVLVLALAQSI